MPRNYANEAMRLEKLASSKKSASKHMKNLPQRVNAIEQAARMYEVAVKNWLLEAKESSYSPRKAQYAKLNATHDYGLARRLRGEISEKNYENQTFAILSIISLVGALFFTSLNFSGYAVGDLKGDVSLIGIILFVLGLVFALVFFKSKKKKF